MYQINVYTDVRDRSPVEAWIQELNGQAVRKVMYAIERLERDGTWIARDLGDGIWELRPYGYRVLFFHVGNGEYILLHGFAKKSNKTPRADIEIAKRRRAEWIDRFGQK